MTIAATGFTPGSIVTVVYASKVSPTPRFLASGTADANGAYLTTATPPPFATSKRTEQTFTLVAADNVNPAALATTSSARCASATTSSRAAPGPHRR